MSFSYFVYFQKQRTSKVYLLDATMVFPMALLIFGDGVKQGELSPREPYISVADTYLYVLSGNGWILYPNHFIFISSFKCDTQTSSVILKLRQLLGILLRKKAMHPSPIEQNSSDEQLIKWVYYF